MANQVARLPGRRRRLTSGSAKSEVRPDPKAKEGREPGEVRGTSGLSRSPHEIHASLTRCIRGQDDALRQISMLLSLHSHNITDHSASATPNALVVGPTGVGKTMTFQRAAELLGLPFVVVDTTALVPSGIVGIQIEDVLSDLVDEADDILAQSGVRRSQDDAIRLAERGVIFLDEFDKIAGAVSSTANHQVQRRLLKLCEGAPQAVGVRTHHESSVPPEIMDTSGLLVVAAGAFATLDREQVTSADLIDFGISPELAGRFPVLIHYDALSTEDLVEILSDEQLSPLTVWRRYAQRIGRDLVVDDEALRHIAKKSLTCGLGARGLDQVVFPVLTRITTHALSRGHHSEPIVVTAEDISDSLSG